MQTVVIDVEEGISHPLDEQICSIVGQVLCQHYTGHAWRVDADHQKGFIDIRNLSLSGDCGFRLKMSGHVTASELTKLAVRAGGEILERFNVSRGTINHEEIASLPENEFGRTACEM
jgi:hypothetical protein